MNYENYHLPANFTDAGKLMGMFQIRNTIESLLISAPILYLCLAFLPFEITTRIIAAMILMSKVKDPVSALMALDAGGKRKLF